MNTLIQDLRYAVRMLVKHAGLTAIAVLALALGIGANTAIFSVVYGILIRPLPYKDSSQLVMLWSSNLKTNRPRSSVSYPDFVDFRSRQTVFEHMAAAAGQYFNLTGEGEPAQVRGMRVTADLFPLLGVGAALGRTLLAEDEQPASQRVVLLGHRLWQNRFGGDARILGSPINLNGEPYTVVGVMAAEVEFPPWYLAQKAELFVPLPENPQRGNRFLSVVARTRPGVSVAAAQAEIEAIAGQLAEAYPQSNADRGVNIGSLHDYIVGDIRPALLLFMGAVGFVLLIACANVANLLLARAAARQKEIGIRAALGASRAQLIRQFLTESVVLALAGGALGVLIALWGVTILVGLSPPSTPRLDEIGIDGRALAFTLLVSIGTGLLFGLAPALAASRPNLNESLKEGGAVSYAGGPLVRLSPGNLLVVGKVALALVLLIGAGLMIKSFLLLEQVAPGFDRANLLTMSISLPREKYSDPRRQVVFFEHLLERVAGLPGVQTAAVVNPLPFSGSDEGLSFTVEARPPAEGDTHPTAGHRVVSQDYFRAMGISVLKGRDFTSEDAEGAPGVVIINETMARTFWPGEDPVGQRMTTALDKTPREIAGVVRDVRHRGLDEEPRPEMYIPLLQRPAASMYLLVRAAIPPEGLVASVRNEVWAVDKDQPITQVNTMEELLSRSVAARRFNVVLIGAFAGVALVLAIAGIYGLVSYSVTRRTNEIGIRMAVGAQQRDILKLLVGQGAKLVILGEAVGLVAAFALTRVLAGFLYGVTATDAATFITVALAVAAISIIASYIPARRATKLDPMVALRYR